MRVDGRKRGDEIRPIRLEPGYTRYAEGSVLVVQGQTVVLCNASMEERLPGWLHATGDERGWVTAEYSMLPRSTQIRRQREGAVPEARTQEIRRMIGRSLRAAVDLNRLGKRQVIVDCDVLQADGGTRTAAITGGYVALVLALRRLIALGTIPPEVLLAPVAAVSVGVIGSEPVLDLCYAEDAQAAVDLNVVMNRDGRFIELQGTAEHAPFERALLDRLLDLAALGIGQLLRVQQEVLES